MLNILVKKELKQILLQSFLRSRKAGKNGKKARSAKGMLALWAFLIVYLVAFFTWGAWMLGRQFLPLPGLGWLYYLLFGAAALLFGVLGSVFNTYSALYLAKDNDLLLSMPIPVKDVILSRLFSVYLMGLFYSASLSLPAMVVGLIQCGFSLPRLLGGLIWVLVISLVVLGLSCLLGWVVARASLKLKNKSILIVLFSLAFMGLYYVVYFRLMNHLPELLESAMRYGENVRGTLNPIYYFGRMGEGDWLSMLLWVLAVCLFLGLVWLLLRHSFLSVATASGGGKKAVYREKAAHQGSASAALLRKEWYRFYSSPAYMLNCGLGLLFLLGLGIYLLIQGKDLLATLTQIPFFAPESGMLPVLACAACCMMSFLVDITAPSVSLEGRGIWQLQSLPVTAWQALRAKLELHLALSTLPTLFCGLIVAFMIPATLAQRLLILANALLFMLLMALLGLALGVRFANLSWTNEMIPIKQSAAVAFTIFGGMGLALAMGGLYLWFGYKLEATGWMGLTALLLMSADAGLFLWLRGSGARRFAALTV